jgi:uncharacterized protein (TIGR03437 family)
VLVNGAGAPLLYTSDSLINFQCPILVAGSPLQVQLVTEGGLATQPIQTTMKAATPALFMVNASGQGAVLVANTNLIAMTHQEGIPSRPAAHGEYISIYGNGFGQVDNGVPAGTPAPLDRLLHVKYAVRVVLGGVEIVPSFAGLAPGNVGLFQINAQIPSTAPAGAAVPLSVQVTLDDGNVLTTNQVTVAIGN